MLYVHICFLSLFVFSPSICMISKSSALEPSVISKVYMKLADKNLVGRLLSNPELKKVRKEIDIKQLKNWKQQVKPFEVMLLFQLGIALEEAGYRKLASDMILYAYEKGNTNNFVIETIQGKVDSQSIEKALEQLGFAPCI